MLKSINEKSWTLLEHETNLDKTNEKGRSIKSDAPSTGLIGSSNKPSTTITFSVNPGAGAI